MVCVITRTINGPLTSLVKAIDASIVKNQKLKCFVVYLASDIGDGSEELRQLTEKAGLKHIPLTIFDDAKGPGGYDIAPKADMTIMMWSGSKVKVNHAYLAGKFTEEQAGIVALEASKF